MKARSLSLNPVRRHGLVCALGFVLALMLFADAGMLQAQQYDCEDDLIEVMFAAESQVRLRHGTLVDLRTKAVEALPAVLNALAWHEWMRLSEVPENRIDEMHAESVARSGQAAYNMNNAYRLRIPKGNDVWAVSADLEALPSIISARPVPKPMPLPLPPDYEPGQGYLFPASSIPCGLDFVFANGTPGGDGLSVTICDLEYSWNYFHADISKAVGSQINSNVADPFSNTDHGTAVIGELVADWNGWGNSGVCLGANLLTCGTYYGSPTPSWNVPGAILLATSVLNPGDVILLEQQWDYNGSGAYIPIEWWLNYSPGAQTYNSVYAAIENAINLGINVVQAGGNGGVDLDALTWYGDNGSIIVGAGGAYTGGTYPEGDMQRISFSCYGSRVNLQGWGEDVITTGYGTLYNAMGVNYYYTSSFSGTSSASPMVAGAVASCVGYWKVNISPTPPPPPNLRTHLVATGTPQVLPPAGNIGPRPDLFTALTTLTPPCSCPHQSDFDTSGFHDAVDLNALINIVFFNGTDIQDSQCPAFRSDFNCDGVPDAVDLNDLINFLFFNGPLPCDPCLCSPYPTNCP